MQQLLYNQLDKHLKKSRWDKLSSAVFLIWLYKNESNLASHLQTVPAPLSLSVISGTAREVWSVRALSVMPQTQVLFFSVVDAQRNVFLLSLLWYLVNHSWFTYNGLLIEVVSMHLGKSHLIFTVWKRVGQHSPGRCCLEGSLIRRWQLDGLSTLGYHQTSFGMAKPTPSQLQLGLLDQLQCHRNKPKSLSDLSGAMK